MVEGSVTVYIAMPTEPRRTATSPKGHLLKEANEKSQSV